MPLTAAVICAVALLAELMARRPAASRDLRVEKRAEAAAGA